MGSEKQNCFKCGWEGKLWPFEGKRGIPKECDGCKGQKLIEGFVVMCPLCEGTGVTYPHANKTGIAEPCKLCEKKGYIDHVPIGCKKGDETGRIWPFADKRGIPSDCEVCKGKGYTEGEQLPIKQPEPEPEPKKPEQPQHVHDWCIIRPPGNFTCSGCGRYFISFSWHCIISECYKKQYCFNCYKRAKAND